MRRPISKWPIAAFTLPPHPPDAVKDAYEQFDRLGHEFGRLRGELQDAEQEVRGARTKDVRRIADAASEGKSVPDQSKFEDQSRGKVATLERKIEGTALALDEAGNELAKAIGLHRTEWVGVLTEAEREASARFTAALAEAKAALADIRPARGGVEWLERFEADAAVVGNQPQFSGGRVVVDTSRLAREPSTPDADRLVEVLETVAVGEMKKPQPNDARRAA